MHRTHCVLTAPLYLFIESKFGILFVIQPLVKWYVLSRQGQADQEKVKEYWVFLGGAGRGNTSLSNESCYLISWKRGHKGKGHFSGITEKKEALLTNTVCVEWMILVFMITFEARTTASWLAGPWQHFSKHVFELCKSAPIKPYCFSCLVSF